MIRSRGDARAVSTGNEPPCPISSTASTSFRSLKQIDARLLNIGYAEDGPANGPAVILLHGWPYDIYSFADVTPLLAAAGYRVIVPYLRGCGTTSLVSSDTFRNGQPSALALDIIELMDALNIQKAILAGFDWGARIADIVAALWPERCKALVSVSGYLIGSQEAGKAPLPPKAELQWWYQFYFARWRQALAQGEAKYDNLEKRLAAAPIITVPAITLEGDDNGAPHLDPVHAPRNSPAIMCSGRLRAASGTICRKKRRRPL
jgi:pimeloyl-ACP methyl ester carboxylesterase